MRAKFIFFILLFTIGLQAKTFEVSGGGSRLQEVGGFV